MPAPSYEQMQDLFRAHTEAALKVIVEIMNGSGGKGDAVRLSAAKEILSRAWGKPASREKVGHGKTNAKDLPDKATGDAPDKPTAVAEIPSDEVAPSPAATAQPAARAPAPWFRSSPSSAKSAARAAIAGG